MSSPRAATAFGDDRREITRRLRRYIAREVPIIIDALTDVDPHR